MIDLSAPVHSWLPIVWYAAFRPGLPELCVGRWPSGIAVDSPWKLWAVENKVEREALLAALERPIPTREGALDFSAGPDAAVCRPGTGDPMLALYNPPGPGWPWITLGRWPPEIGHQVGAHRGVYTWDADLSEAAACERVASGVIDGVMRADLLLKPAAGST